MHELLHPYLTSKDKATERIACNGAGGRVGFEINASRAGPLMRVVRRIIETELGMHEFRCTCGSSIVVDPPSPNAGYLIWDSDVDASIDKRRIAFHGFLTALHTGQRDAWMRYFYGSTTHDRLHLKTDVDVLEDILSAQDSYTHFCYRCSLCGRLHVQFKHGVDGYNAFRPED